uniref:Capsid protein n=1 Tax=Soybean carlavirus 1 TaxID=2796532 RepID=A0A8B0MWZ3_9VIRU|nr:coat protein [Soybean carlavirus 1]
MSETDQQRREREMKERAEAEMRRRREQQEVNQRPEGSTGGNGAEMEEMQLRLNKLEGILRKERSGLQITNASFETGRPPLKPTDDMKGDPQNVYNRPSTDFLWGIKPKPVSNNMANSEEMSKIKVRLEGLGVPTEHVYSVILQLVFKCASTSSSSYQDPQGTFEFPGGAIMADDVVGTVQEIAGLRRVCRLYAPVTWNYMHLHNKPPSDWAALGFQANTKYAAFDCFDYVENEAAIKPSGGISPRPSRAEYVAYNTYKTLALDKANNNDTYANTSSEITGGRMGPEITRNFNNANNKKQ